MRACIDSSQFGEFALLLFFAFSNHVVFLVFVHIVYVFDMSVFGFYMATITTGIFAGFFRGMRNTGSAEK